jgi:hypothetical protein
MSTKIAISIGKGLGNLIQVEDSSRDRKPFRSFLRLLMELDVYIPLKPSFNFRREGGEPLDILLKYERLDIYCCSCGRIRHKSIHCIVALEERVLGKYAVSLHVNMFSSLFPFSSSRTPAISPNPQKQPSPSQIKALGSSNLSQTNMFPVTNAPSILAPTHPFPMRQKISLPLVTSLHTSLTSYDLVLSIPLPFLLTLHPLKLFHLYPICNLVPNLRSQLLLL